MQKLLVSCLMLICLCTTLVSIAVAADPYFGFKLGRQNFGDVRKDLKDRGAVFTDNLNYRGYNELRSMQIVQHGKLALEGTLRYANLDFDPSDRLYKVTISWDDEGNLFQRWKNILNNYVGFIAEDCKTKGFDQECVWQNNTVTFRLHYDPAGFGRNSSTILSFVNNLAVPSVDAAKQRIDADLAKDEAVREANRFRNKQ